MGAGVGAGVGAAMVSNAGFVKWGGEGFTGFCPENWNKTSVRYEIIKPKRANKNRSALQAAMHELAG